MKHLALFLLLFAAAKTACAVPMLKTQAEPVAAGELKAKVLVGSVGVPAPTPQMRQYVLTTTSPTGERTERTVKWYGAEDLWRARAFVGEWKDRKGNVMRLSRVRSLVPEIPRGEGEREAVEKALDAAEAAFTGSPDELAAWRKCWGGKGPGKIVETKDRRYFVEFDFAESVKAAEVENLLKTFEKSLSTRTVGSAGALAAMKWWETSNAEYRFLTDLDRAKGGKFVKDAMRLMGAMRKSYETYVPSKGTLGVCTVRVFKTLQGYRDYRASTGDDDQMSAGLWDPSRDELLIAAENRDEAQRTMRHEAFHQYLHYATGNGNHAMWFNEGHACFFESVSYNPAKNTVRVTDEGNRAAWVARNPALYANRMTSVLAMPREVFYSGDVNLNYCTAWALVYFLEKGAYTSEDFAPYRKVIPKYLELTAAGMPASAATAEAWRLVGPRNIADDFLRFWKTSRKAAVKAR